MAELYLIGFSYVDAFSSCFVIMFNANNSLQLTISDLT